MLVREHVFLNKVYNTVKWIVNTPKDWSSNTHNKNQKKSKNIYREGRRRQNKAMIGANRQTTKSLRK